jgi:hypothetical protein
VASYQETVIRTTGRADRIVVVQPADRANDGLLAPGREVVLMGYIVRDAGQHLPGFVSAERDVIWVKDAIVAVN